MSAVQFKTYNVDAHKVEASDSIITGNNNIIFGNNNRIAGNTNKVYGNNNAIVGNNNVVKGENNIAKGDSNEVYDPFGNVYTQPTTPSSPYTSNPFASQDNRSTPSPHFFIPPTQTQDRSISPANGSAFIRPVPTRERSSTYPYVNLPAYEPPAPFQPVPTANYPVSPPPVHFPNNANAYFQPVQQLVAPEPNSYYQPNDTNSYYSQQGTPSTNSNNANAYFQQDATQYFQQDAIQFAPQPVAAYIVLASPSSPTPYVNPFAPSQEQKDSPFTPRGQEKKEDLIQDGTLVFIINETDAEYVREFCTMVSTNSGQRLGCHISAGRMCLVGLGDLNKIRDTIIQNLPLLNLKLKEWSWNTFGKNVCNDKEVYFKRLFKEYTKEDVDCWRNKPTKMPA